MNERSDYWWHCKEPFSSSKDAANQPQHWIRRVILMRHCVPGTPQRKQRRNDRRCRQPKHADDDHDLRQDEPRQQHVMNPTWKSLLFSPHLADVAVHCHDEITLPAHKKILAAASPTLAQMLVPPKASKRSASRSAKIVHWNVPYPAYVMRAVLSFIYVGPQDPLHRRLIQHEPWTLWNVAQTFSLVWLLHELDQAQAPRQAPGATAGIKSILRNHPRSPPLQNGGALENPSSLRQRRRTQSSTSSTISSSASSVSTATSATSLYGKRQYDLKRDKYLVPESDDEDDDDEGDYVSQRSRDRSSQSAESIVSRGSNSIKNDDDDDDESSAAHPWLSSYLFLTAAQTNCCHPDKRNLNSSRDVPADYSSATSQYEDDDASQDDEDDDDHIFDEEEDVDDDGDDDDDEDKLEDEEPVGPLPQPLRTERQDSSMSDLTTSTDRRRVYQRIHHEKLREDQRYYNPTPTSGCLNPIGLYTDAKPEQLLLIPQPMQNSSAPIGIESQSGLELMVPTPANNHISAIHPPQSSKFRSSTTAAQLSFREKFQRKIRNRLLESERHSQPNLIPPQNQSQPLSQLPGNKSNDCSPESSMNVDKIELLNVETGTSYQHHNNKAQQQQHHVELLIRGPSMTFSTGMSLPVGRSASLLPLDYCARRDNRHDGEVHDIESTFDSVPAVVSPLSAETTRKEKASTGIYLSPPRIHRLVTPTSTKSVRAVVHHNDVDLMKTNRHQQVADPTNLTITTTTDLGTGEIGRLVHLTQDHHRLQQASAAARSRMRDSSVDSRMAALVLSRMEDQQQQRQHSSSDHQLGDDYCDDLLINTEHDSGLSLNAPSSLSLTMREGSNVEVTISSKACRSQDRQVLSAPNHTKISRQDMIQKLRRVVALYKKPVAENI